MIHIREALLGLFKQLIHMRDKCIWAEPHTRAQLECFDSLTTICSMKTCRSLHLKE